MYRGAWSDWKKENSIYGSMIAKYSDGSGFVLKTSGEVEYFSFRINHYMPPTKDEIKEHRKNGMWFEYSGVVEYYVNDFRPTAEAIAKACYFVKPDPRRDETPVVKRTAPAKIRIAPYKTRPECFNIFFDNIGVGLQIDKELKFQDEKPRNRGGRIVANIIQSIFLFPIGIGSWWWNPVNG